MKYFTAVLLLFVSLASHAQMTLEEWNRQAETNIRLLPKYGNAEKTEDEKKADKDFIAKATEQFGGDLKAASKHMIGLGFNYLYKGDIKTAMYRFNQAWLLDPKNTDTYWGFGVIYMVLGDTERGIRQYEEGLKLNPENTNILTDYGTYYLGKYYEHTDKKDIDFALEYLHKSYDLDKTNQNTLFKLSVVYLLMGECKDAIQYYNECKALGGAPLTEDYTKDLFEQCP